MASITRGPNTMPSSSELLAQPVGAVDAGAGDLAGGPQAGERRGAVEVGDDAAAVVVGGGRDGQAVRGGIEPGAAQVGGDGGEALVEALEAGGVEEHVVGVLLEHLAR